MYSLTVIGRIIQATPTFASLINLIPASQYTFKSLFAVLGISLAAIQITLAVFPPAVHKTVIFFGQGAERFGFRRRAQGRGQKREQQEIGGEASHGDGHFVWESGGW